MFEESDFVAGVDELRRVLSEVSSLNSAAIVAAWHRLYQAVSTGKTIFFAGNGGSASQSAHMAAEFVGRFKIERNGWPAMSLCENLSTLTAIGNDYSYDEVFSRQVRALCGPGDVLVLFSTSGKSRNVIRAAEVGRELGVFVIGLTGKGGGELKTRVDVCIDVPSTDVTRIQEAHLMIGHVLCSVSDHVSSGKVG